MRCHCSPRGWTVPSRCRMCCLCLWRENAHYTEDECVESEGMQDEEDYEEEYDDHGGEWRIIDFVSEANSDRDEWYMVWVDEGLLWRRFASQVWTEEAERSCPIGDVTLTELHAETTLRCASLFVHGIPQSRWPTLAKLAVNAAEALLAQPRQRMEYDEFDSIVEACTDYVMCVMKVRE